MNDRLTALRLFVRVARSGSFSAAARAENLSQPSVSRIIAGLERDIGAALLRRSTRSVSLTEAGSDYLHRVERLLADLDAADQAARGDGMLRGTLHIALSTSFGVREVVPRLPAFLGMHPQLRIELAMTDRRQDLVGEGIDLALRLGELPDSSAIAVRLAEARRVIVAAPAYLALRGRPLVPADLSGHDVIVGPGQPGTARWEFGQGGRQVSVRIDGRIVVAANEGATACSVAGLGLAAMSAWGCGQELADGRLQTVLDDWPMARVPLHAMLPQARAASPAARAFIDWFRAALDS